MRPKSTAPSGAAADGVASASIVTSKAACLTPRSPAPPPVARSTITAGSPSMVASEKWYCWQRSTLPAGSRSSRAAGGRSVAVQ